MKFGVCYDIEKALRDCPVNTDYLEVWGRDIWAMERADFDRICRAALDRGIRSDSCCRLIDPSLRLTGEDVDFAAIGAYCDRLFERLAALGVTVLVFGSGKAKHVPEGFPREKAWDQLFTVGDLLAQKAKPFGQTVVVEPLSYKEVNIVNTVEEAAYYVKQVNRDNFRVLVDFYHFDSNGEDWESLARHKDVLAHAHFATS
ncbi:MAG: sugar phosphate isomerase/epimerase, partial [Clostridia bacterium]|nr:sugar phosphate isomerase/epimerase [Clostridia bacterium]